MGANCSSFDDLNSNEVLLKFCGTIPISQNDPLWNQMFSFSAQIPRKSEENKLFVQKTQVLFDLLRTSNPSTGNFHSMIRVFLTRAIELKTSAQCDDKLFIWQTANALFVIRSVLMHCVQSERSAEVSTELLRRISESPHLTEDLIVQLIEILIDIPLQQDTASLHLESLNAVILLLYTAAFSYTANKKSPILRCLMTGKGALHAGLLTRTLLNHFCLQLKVEANWLGRNSAGGSLVLGLASGIWGLLSRNSTSADTDCGPVFASQALLLLLILANHCTNEDWTNPYRQALLSFTDSQDPVQVSPVHPAGCFRANYSALYGTLCDQLEDERATLLLYLLLHQHQQFRNYVYSHADLQRLVLALLQVLYKDRRCGSHHLYMSLIILLLLSEDEGFSSNIHNIIIRNPTWYSDRSLPEISLGGLVILVIIRTVQQNIINTKDKYLHTNCLATLANMAAHFRRIHPYVCQRLVSLLVLLNKKLIRISQPTAAVAVEEAAAAAQEEREQDMAFLEEIIRMLLEILNAALSHQLSSNLQLVYSLLYQREIFDSLRRNANLQDVVSNLDTILNYFATKIGMLSDPGVSEIMQAIQQGSADFPKDRLKKFPDLKFRYVEEEQPEEFFVPYVWSLVQSSSNVCWTSAESLNEVSVGNGIHC